MKGVTLFILVIVSVSAIPVQEVKDAEEGVNIAMRNSQLEQAILNVLEDLRELMINGSDDIPVLDPLEVEQAHIDLDFLGLDDSYLAVSNAVVNHLSTFVVDDLSFGMTSFLPQRYTLEIDGRIPVLEIAAENYDMDVDVLGLKVFGNGEVKFQIIEPRITGTIVFGVRIIPLPIGLNMQSVDIKFKLTGFQTHITGLFDGDEFLNNFVSLFLQHFVPEAVVYFEDEISSAINEIVLAIGNEILADLDLGSILG